ncbi:hypothetical protein SLH49_20530 [Cognatiyoonia sp. IB215446]|uniref:hypothetical protein n=1 Tax=Cognatiyoonia sp. IB215446 TaxID=3097355 RepID=UPI002A12F6B7|nr:hypothetical protein [Cognatiyoonia sp. IB215446]MDX8350382.1 hypothetical protein [Cognatiyoonia sp. IB215446]
MLVSHRYQFIVFPDPLGACPWISRALEPWLDQPIVGSRNATTQSNFFRDMSPAEAELAFDVAGFAFRKYTRIAIVRHPAQKMVQLYDRIAKTNKIWRMRRSVGVGDPGFTRWLASTRPNGYGAAPFGGPRWRRFGAWSGEAWCGDYVSHVVRAENAEEELTEVFHGLGISPGFSGHALDALTLMQPTQSRYNAEARTILRNRYAWDLNLYGHEAKNLQLVA